LTGKLTAIFGDFSSEQLIAIKAAYFPDVRLLFCRALLPCLISHVLLQLSSELSEAGKLVLQESQQEYKKAQAVLDEVDEKEVEVVVSHKFCVILLNGGVSYMYVLSKSFSQE
jgi:hypothetical protein